MKKVYKKDSVLQTHTLQPFENFPIEYAAIRKTKNFFMEKSLNYLPVASTVPHGQHCILKQPCVEYIAHRSTQRIAVYRVKIFFSDALKSDNESV